MNDEGSNMKITNCDASIDLDSWELDAILTGLEVLEMEVKVFDKVQLKQLIRRIKWVRDIKLNTVDNPHDPLLYCKKGYGGGQTYGGKARYVTTWLATVEHGRGLDLAAVMTHSIKLILEHHPRWELVSTFTVASGDRHALYGVFNEAHHDEEA
jgi:hypothetical protein